MSGSYYVVRGALRNGPFTESQLIDLLQQGRIDADDECVADADDDEVPVRVGDLFESVAAAPTRTVRRIEDEEPTQDGDDRWEEPDDRLEEMGPRHRAGGDAALPDRSGGPRPPRVLRTHPSFLSYPGSLLGSAASLAAGWWLAPEGGWFAFGGIACFTAFASFLVFHRSSREYRVNPRRVELYEGLLARSSREIRVADIRAINVRTSGIAGLLGLGDVEFLSAGSEGVDVAFRNVWRPHRIKRLVRRLQDEAAR